MKITIIGGGNIGTCLAGELAAAGHEICVYTKQPTLWSASIQVLDVDDNLLCVGKLSCVTNDIELAIKSSEVIIITWPAHIRARLFRMLAPYVREHHLITLVPGLGGSEYMARQELHGGAVICGLQRVPFIARVDEVGRSVKMLGRKKELYLGKLGRGESQSLCRLMTALFHIPCIALNNYLEVTLTPSNPILHTARLFRMFSEYEPGKWFTHCPLFYEDWDDQSSMYLLGADAERQILCDRITQDGLRLSNVISLAQYYESTTPELLTRKIRSIQAFRGIPAPMKVTNNGFVPDLMSRYFQEDFPFGLCVIKGLCELGDIQTPTIDRILHWYEKIAGMRYYDGEQFSGPDVSSSGAPQRYGMRSIRDIIQFYSK